MGSALGRAAAADGAAGWRCCLRRQDQVVVAVDLQGEGLAALFCFEDEVTLLVEVDEPSGDGAVEIANLYGFIKDVGVEVLDAGGRVRAIDFEKVAEFREEWCVVGAFGGVGLLPSRYEVLRRGRH
jgi:hypothetical protein